MDEFNWYLHEIVVRYMKGKYPDVKVNYATFASFFEKSSTKFLKMFQSMPRPDFEQLIKNDIEREVDRIMNERFLALRIPK